MLEFIGMVVVVWIVYSLIKGFFQAKSVIRSQEFGKEAKYIAVNELGVPEVYFTYSVVNHIDLVKKSALEIKEKCAGQHDLSWSRSIAWAVYCGFRNECDRYEAGNPNNKLNKLGVPPDVIINAILVDPADLVPGKFKRKREKS